MASRTIHGATDQKIVLLSPLLGTDNTIIGFTFLILKYLQASHLALRKFQEAYLYFGKKQTKLVSWFRYTHPIPERVPFLHSTATKHDRQLTCSQEAT